MIHVEREMARSCRVAALIVVETQERKEGKETILASVKLSTTFRIGAQRCSDGTTKV